MKERDWIGEISAANEVVEKALDAQRQLLDEYAAATCPYKVGQEVDVQGYSHRGKRCRILKVWGDDCGWAGMVKPVWRVRAVVLKKDGTDSRQHVAWDQTYEKENE